MTKGSSHGQDLSSAFVFSNTAVFLVFQQRRTKGTGTANASFLPSFAKAAEADDSESVSAFILL